MPLKTKNRPASMSFRDLLRKAGFKATPARLAMLNVIKSSKKPLSAQEIIERLGKGFDQTTIYRFMKKLSAIGIIRQIDLRTNHAQYEFFDLDDHHHLICVRCGRIEDIIGCEVEDMYKTILNSTKNFSEVRQHSLEFYGTCNRCVAHN